MFLAIISLLIYIVQICIAVMITSLDKGTQPFVVCDG